MFIVMPSSVGRVDRLRLRKVGSQMLGRGLRVIPRNPLGNRTFWRILFDQAPLRYCLALSPFPVAMLIRPDLALAISQAPLLMFALVFTIESSVLSVQTPAKRRKLIAEAEADRGRDILKQRGADVLSRIAAARGQTHGVLHLVVEQSGLARIPVLTLVSVQAEAERPGAPPELLDLSETEQEILRERLFDEAFPETLLHTINLADNTFLRTVALEARTVSAHARLMAMAKDAKRAGATAAG